MSHGDDATPRHSGVLPLSDRRRNRPRNTEDLRRGTTPDDDWRFHVVVEALDGAVGDQRRAELSDITRQLLLWASDDHEPADREAA